MDWEEYYYNDYGDGGGDDGSIVTMAPFEVTPGDDDSNVGAPDDSEGYSNWNFPVNFGPDDGGGNEGDELAGLYVVPDPTSQILASLNGYRPGWEKVSDSLYKNRTTGETYNADTGNMTSPKSSTNPNGTRTAAGTGGSSTGTGGGSSGGSSGGSQSSSGNSTLEKALATIGALVSNFAKVSGAVTDANVNRSPAATAAQKTQQDAQMGKLVLAGAAVAFLLWAKRKKSA